jgi:hypothetical protein
VACLYRRILFSINVLGIDFTSRPTRRKPPTCFRCTFDGLLLRAGHPEDQSLLPNDPYAERAVSLHLVEDVSKHFWQSIQ